MSTSDATPEIQTRQTAQLSRNAPLGQAVDLAVATLLAYLGYISRPGPTPSRAASRP